MIALNYKLTSYRDFLKELADVLGTTVREDTLTIPPAFGKGFLKVVDLGNGLESVVYHLNLTDDIMLRREKEVTEYYILGFDEFNKRDGAHIKVASESLEGSPRTAAIYLNSFIFDLEMRLHKNVVLNGMRVFLPVAWLQRYLQLSEKEDVLERYISLKTSGVWSMPVDNELRELLQGLVTEEETPLLFYQNKIMRIIEKFFDWLYNQMLARPEMSSISRSDIESAQKIESILTTDVTILPPTIRELSKEVAMSESKLKKIFKVVYGMPPYEYYQKQRMQKARSMLLTGNYSIKDIGYTLGYSNLSNFTLAFKKEFGERPSDVKKTVK